MHKQILKRHGNYILRIREIKDNNIVYTWLYSKELSNIIKNYGKIEDWQLDNIEHTLYESSYSYIYQLSLRLNFSFREDFRKTQSNYIKDMIQYTNKVGKYSENKNHA